MSFDFSNKSKFNSQIIKNIFVDIADMIKQNVAKLHKTIEDDSNDFGEKYDFSGLMDIVERTNTEECLLSKSNKNTYYYGIGNVGVCYNGSPEVFLYMVLKAIKTNNNIVFFECEEPHATNAILLDLVKNVCEKNDYKICIETVTVRDNAELAEVSSELDMFIFINEQQRYLDFCARNSATVKIKCSNYGTMDLFLDDKQLENRLIEMDEYVYNRNIDLEIYKNDSVENVVKRINLRKNNFCAVIFTNNSKDAYYFIENVDAEKVFVNRNPQNSYFYEIDDRELTLKKSIFY